MTRGPAAGATEGRSRFLRHAAVLAVAVAITRVAAIAAMSRVAGAGKRDFADDVAMHLGMAREPLALLLGDTGTYGQHPVLLPFVEWLLLLPVRGLGDFWSMRLAYVAAEIVLVVAVLDIVPRGVPRGAGGPGGREVRAWMVLAVASPVLWMTSAVMAQDEVIAGAFLAGGLALWTRRRETAAMAVLGLGVAGGKVFLVLPLVALVLIGPRATRLRRAVVGGLVAGVPYLVAAALARSKGNPVPLSGFSPDARFGVNPWVFALRDGVVSVDTAKVASLALALTGAAVPLLAVRGRLRRGEAEAGLPDHAVGAVVAAMLLWFFVLFYHSTPEYLVLLVPPLALAGLGLGRAVVVHAALSVAWLVNFFYGVAVAEAEGTPGAKAEIVRLYRRVLSIDPTVGQDVLVVVFTLAAAAVAARLTKQAGSMGFRGAAPAD